MIDADIEERIRRVEEQVQILNNRLPSTFVQGRLRWDRTSPASSSDVQSSDKLWDRCIDTSYEYVLVNNAGTLEWLRIIMSSF